MEDQPSGPPDTHSSLKTTPPASNGAGKSQMGLLGLGLQLAVTVALFALVGWWLDKRMNWTPWGMVGFGMAGLGFGLFQFVKDATR